MAISAPINLLVEGQHNPERLITLIPTFSWDLHANGQSAYEIQISTVADFGGNFLLLTGKILSGTIVANYLITNVLVWNEPGVVWGTTKVWNDDRAGDELARRVKYYWRIRIWDSNDNISDWTN